MVIKYFQLLSLKRTNKNKQIAKIEKKKKHQCIIIIIIPNVGFKNSNSEKKKKNKPPPLYVQPIVKVPTAQLRDESKIFIWEAL